jgi:hypothetical protein
MPSRAAQWAAQAGSGLQDKRQGSIIQSMYELGIEAEFWQAEVRE